MQVRRESGLTESDFTRHYLAARQPVIATGEIATWPAMSRWRWDYFARLFGDREIDVYDHWFSPTGTTTLGEFIAGNIGVTGADPNTSYVRWFARHKPGDGRWADDVFHAIEPDWRRPSFAPSSGYVVPFAAGTRRVDPVTDPFPYRALFMSAAGARTAMHMDPWWSAALLCQITGTKQISLYSSEQHDDIMAAVLAGHDRRELADRPPTFSDVLAPGEILFIPDGWWHHVTTLTDSISLTWNFVHASAAGRLLDYVRSGPDDPELESVSYLLSSAAPELGSHDVVALVENSVNSFLGDEAVLDGSLRKLSSGHRGPMSS